MRQPRWADCNRANHKQLDGCPAVPVMGIPHLPCTPQSFGRRLTGSKRQPNDRCACRDRRCQRLVSSLRDGRTVPLYQVLFNFVLLTANFEPTNHSTLLTLQNRERFTFTLRHLIHRALMRVFVRTPSKKFCTVPKSAAGKMVIRNFDDDLWSDRFSFVRAIRTPTAGSSRGVASKSGWFFERFKFFC